MTLVVINGRRKMQHETVNHLKPGTVLLVTTQEELNLLLGLTDGMAYDSLVIDEDYIAYHDEVLHIMPFSQIDQSYPREFEKPRRFMPWYRSVKRKLK